MELEPNRRGLPSFDSARLERFFAFADTFGPVFPRAGQFQRFRAYLRGLLEPEERKNVGAIASRCAGMIPGEVHLAQTLQHFVTQSPWDTNRLLAAYRGAIAPALTHPGATWVVHDGVVAKKGRHSVGVQRQFARSVGRKLNCQIAVVVSQVGPHGYFPLAARLYLPANWLRDHDEVAKKTVPEEFREPASKSEVALSLVDELRAEGWPIAAVEAESGYATVSDFADGLAAREVLLQEAIATPAKDALGEARRGFDCLKTTLGLDHYEGRTWMGWHHHLGLVFVAHAFLAAERMAAGNAPILAPHRSTISS